MKVNEIITNKIIEQLEKGCVPWKKPWAASDWPKNLVSKKNYQGINVFLLSYNGFKSNYWLTFKQAQELGGSVKKGEKGSLICFYSKKEKDDDETGETKKYFVLRYYTVFNVEQCEGIEDPSVTHNNGKVFNPIRNCEELADSYKDCPNISYGGGRAAYSPSSDKIMMPVKNDFHSSESYYSTLFHEMIHSTGHESRLNRESLVKNVGFGSEIYSKEELVAEMGAAFCCGYSGISPEVIENQAAYINSWLSKLRKDKNLVIVAASAAQKAFNYILGKSDND